MHHPSELETMNGLLTVRCGEPISARAPPPKGRAYSGTKPECTGFFGSSAFQEEARKSHKSLPTEVKKFKVLMFRSILSL